MVKCKLSELFDMQMGKTPARNRQDYWDNGTNPWITIADMTSNGKYILTTKEYITDTAVYETGIKPIFPGTVIMSFKLSVGKVARTTVKSYSNEAIMAFEIKDAEPSKYTIDNDYAYYLLSALNFDNIGNKAVMGKTLNKAILQNTIVHVHNWDKQRKIVAQLENLDNIIDKRKQQLAKLDELIKARFVEMFGDPVTNPKGWDISLIEEVVANEKNALKAGPFGSTLKKEYYVSSGYKIYGQEQVISGDPTFGDYYIDEERYKTLENCAVQAGDVLISLVGTYGKLLVMPEEFEPGIINPRLMKITFDKKRVNPYYFQYYFQSESLKKALAENTHGGTMDILNLGIVRKLAMPLPPLELQDEFVAFIEQTDKSKFKVQQSLKKLEILKKSLMQEYFG